MMGLKVHRSLLEKFKQYDPAWYAVIADEATDVADREQFTLSIRSVDDSGAANMQGKSKGVATQIRNEDQPLSQCIALPTH